MVIYPQNDTVTDEFVTRFWYRLVFESFQSGSTAKSYDPKSWSKIPHTKRYRSYLAIVPRKFGGTILSEYLAITKTTYLTFLAKYSEGYISYSQEFR